MRKFDLVVFILLVLGSGLLGGCGLGGDSQSFVREDIDLGYYEKVAVLPFENHTSDAFAADRLRDIAMTQLMATGSYDVVDKGLVDSVLLEEAIEKNAPLSKATLGRLGQLLNVQAVLLGSVDQASEARGGGGFGYPEVSLTLRLVDTSSGTVVWQASGHRSGYSLAGRLFGAAPKDEFQISLDLIKDLLAGVVK
ncbi:MAG: hypothetical protein A2521_08740 [Deltaproteobacteria bacterium RIFOXYD12_FULL_57_12]|nr:MAG: hypothetical protein A2521_08740 [Deltaproteobacteria bacterium RIFOXYD12_FULL_57_12]